MSVLEIRSIHHSFGSLSVLRDINFSLADGGFLCLLGPSGSGKTTLLRIIAGLLSPKRGTVHVNGVDQEHIPTNRRDMGFVFQSPEALFPHLTVFGNVAFPFQRGGRRVQGVPWRDAVHAMLGKLDIASYADSSIAILSGGEKQRVALARALAYRPTLLLLDEPLSSLDNVLKASLIAQMQELHRDLGSTFIYVTHDEREALQLATHLAILDDGVLEQFGTLKAVTSAPRNEKVARIIGGWSLLAAKADAKSGRIVLPGNVLLDPPGVSRPEEVWTIGIPTRSLSVIPLQNSPQRSPGTSVSLPATVRAVNAVYHEKRLRCSLEDGQEITCITEHTKAIAVGAPISLSFRREEAYVFEK